LGSASDASGSATSGEPSITSPVIPEAPQAVPTIRVRCARISPEAPFFCSAHPAREFTWIVPDSTSRIDPPFISSDEDPVGSRTRISALSALPRRAIADRPPSLVFGPNRDPKKRESAGFKDPAPQRARTCTASGFASEGSNQKWFATVSNFQRPTTTSPPTALAAFGSIWMPLVPHPTTRFSSAVSTAARRTSP
jgi:hypothetical protein